jgi:hypothetical protein
MLHENTILLQCRGMIKKKYARQHMHCNCVQVEIYDVMLTERCFYVYIHCYILATAQSVLKERMWRSPVVFYQSDECSLMIHVTYTKVHFNTWSASLSLQAPWFYSATISRFGRPECVESRTWEQIGEAWKSSPEKFSAGGLGWLSSEDFGQWYCFKEHKCLYTLSYASSYEAMCYVFNDKDEKFYAWCLESEKPQQCSLS